MCARHLALLLLLATASPACGAVARVPRAQLSDAPATAPVTASTALFLVRSPGDALRVARVDAAARTVALVTPPLPAGVSAGGLLASPAQDRFVVTGEKDGHGVLYAGTRDGWTVLDTVADDTSFMVKTSPSFAYVAVTHVDRIGRVSGGRVVRFDGTPALDLGIALDPAGLTDDSVVAVEYGTERYGDDVVRSSGATLPWFVYDLASRRRAPMGERTPDAHVAPVDDGFVVVEGGCSAFRTASPDRPAATFACDYLVPPLAVDGTGLYLLRADGRERVGTLPDLDGALLAHHVEGGMSTFVSLRPEDHTQIVTFVAADGARRTVDPGASGGRDFGASWTRVAGRGDLACALVSRTGCASGWTGTCSSDVVDIACSDGRALRTRRIERTGSAEPAETRAEPHDLTLTEDARFVLWAEEGVLHAVDTASFDETVLEAASLAFSLREGEIPDAFGRIR